MLKLFYLKLRYQNRNRYYEERRESCQCAKRTISRGLCHWCHERACGIVDQFYWFGIILTGFLINL